MSVPRTWASVTEQGTGAIVKLLLCLGTALWASFAPAVAVAGKLPLFRGHWATNARFCGLGIGTPNEASHLYIRPGRLQLYETYCRIRDARHRGGGFYDVFLGCTAEGTRFAERWQVRKHSPRRFTLNTGSMRQTYVLCR